MILKEVPCPNRCSQQQKNYTEEPESEPVSGYRIRWMILPEGESRMRHEDEICTQQAPVRLRPWPTKAKKPSHGRPVEENQRPQPWTVIQPGIMAQTISKGCRPPQREERHFLPGMINFPKQQHHARLRRSHLMTASSHYQAHLTVFCPVPGTPSRIRPFLSPINRSDQVQACPTCDCSRRR